jgi:glycosyltransferase involved in cell wall biosynthesis
MYTAQNIDKRFPPPFAQHERAAYDRVAALYPCSRQAASVARGKGFRGLIEVLPLGFDPSLFHAGSQSADDDEVVLALFGRLVPEKGIRDAVRALSCVNASRPARLVVVGSGPEAAPAHVLATELGVGAQLDVRPWLDGPALAALYREAHVVLVPSRPTETWTEQFGRVIVEAQASGAVVAGYGSGSIPEVAGRAALLATVGDVEGLARQVVAALGDPELYQDLRAQGFRLSEERTWARVAARQVALYERVTRGDVETVELPRSPRLRRRRAVEEFGATAPTTAGLRPFALPLLRRGGAAANVLARSIDWGAELKARLLASTADP